METFKYLSMAAFISLILLAMQSATTRANFMSFSIFSVLQEMPNSDPVRHLIQENVVWSWSKLLPVQNILLFFYNDKSCSYVRQTYGNITCRTLSLTSCFDATYNRPYINCVFDMALQNVQTPILMFASGDIMLDETIFHSVSFINDQVEDFFVVGYRKDYEVTQSLSQSNPKALLRNASIYGELQASESIDLIAFRSESSIRMLPFLVGAYRWDNWLLSEILLRTNKTVVDITESSHIIHLQPKNMKDNESSNERRPDALYNDKLAKNISGHDYKMGLICNAHKVLIGDCQKDRCELKDNFQRSEQILIKQKANADNYVAVLTVNSGYMPLAWNWVSYR